MTPFSVVTSPQRVRDDVRWRNATANELQRLSTILGKWSIDRSQCYADCRILGSWPRGNDTRRPASEGEALEGRCTTRGPVTRAESLRQQDFCRRRNCEPIAPEHPSCVGWQAERARGYPSRQPSRTGIAKPGTPELTCQSTKRVGWGLGIFSRLPGTRRGKCLERRYPPSIRTLPVRR